MACPPGAPGGGQIPPKGVFLLVSWPVYSFACVCIHPTSPAEAEATAVKMLKEALPFCEGSSPILVHGAEVLAMRDSKTVTALVRPLLGDSGRVSLAALLRLDPHFKGCTYPGEETSFY